MIYITYFITMFLSSFLIKNRTQSLVFVLFLTLSVLIFSFPGGNDWIGYFQNYDCIVNDKCYSGLLVFEPGYEFIVSVIGKLGFQFIIIFIAFLNVFYLYKFSSGFNNKALIIFFIMSMLFWTLYTEAIRQSLAFSIILFGMRDLLNGKYIKFTFLVIFSSLFHVTSLVCLLLVLPFFSIKLSRFVSYGLLVLGVFFIVMPLGLLEYAVSLFSNNSMIGMKLNFYLSSEEYQPQLSIGFGTILDVLLIFLIFISFYRINKNTLYKSEKFHYVVFMGVSIYISFGLLMGKMMPVLTRIGWYGIPLVIILIYTLIGNSIYYDRYKPKNTKIYISSILVLMYFILQILRPFTYDHSRYNIMHQQTIIQKIDSMDDLSMRIEAKKKCAILSQLGYGYLCD